MSRRGRKRKMAVEDKATCEWEKDKILPENLRDEMEAMWEIPQIYHFLQLTKEALNISHLSMYEVERMLLMPKASKQLAHIMTSLLSSPSIAKAKSQRVPPMPYEFWTNILIYKLRSWFKMYQTKHEDSIKVFEALGIEPEFWSIFPGADKIEGMEFHDFTFKQRVWLLKTICDTAMHSRKTIQDEIAKQPWESQCETVLGIDRYGARYVYFPQFLHNDLRVYRHCVDNSVLSTVRPRIVEVKPKIEPIVIKEEPKAVPRMVVRRKRRKSRWSNGSLPPKQKAKKKVDLSFTDSADSNSNSIDTCFSRSSKNSEVESTKSSGYETMVSGEIVVEESEKDTSGKDIEVEEKEYEGHDDSKDIGSEESFIDIVGLDSSNDIVLEKENLKDIETIDNCSDQSNEIQSTVDDITFNKECTSFISDEVSTNSKTDDEKLEEMNVLKVTEKSEEACSNLTKDVNISKSDDEKLSESKNCDTLINDECVNENTSLGKSTNTKEKEENEQSHDDDSATRRSARIKHFTEIKMEVEDAETALNVSESEELCSIDLRDKICRVSSPELEMDESNYCEKDWSVYDFNKLLCDLSVSNFQLVADSLDSLKDLTDYVISDKTVPDFITEKDYFTRPACEDKLLKRMKVLLASLENVDSILKESTKKARNKLQREWNNFENGVVDEETEAGADRWLVNSQGCAFPSVATLSHSSVSGTRESTAADEVAGDTDTTQTTTDQTAKVKDQGCQGKKGIGQGTIKKKKEEGDKRRREADEDKKDDDGGEPEQASRRVLRARGISSYTEQLFSDDEESEEDQLDGWADIEAIYATPSTQADTSTSDTTAKAQDSGDDTEEEDSDKEWILPSSRQRRNKRPSANRRLKTFHQKLSNIKSDKDNAVQATSLNKEKETKPVPTMRSSTPSKTPSSQPSPAETPEEIQTPAVETPEVKAEKPLTQQPQQETNLHSVLDIKDEGPIYDGSQQPNLLVVTTGHANYVVMQQQNTSVTAVMQPSPFIQPTAFVSPTVVAQPQSYYVQTGQPQNYIVQNHPGLIATAPRPTFITTTNPQLIYQSNQQPMQYVQYVAAPQQQIAQSSPLSSQPRIINTMTLTPPRQISGVRMRAPGNITANRMPTLGRPPFPHPNGAVIRSAPLALNVLRPGQRSAQLRGGTRRQVTPRMQIPNKTCNASTNTPKSTSLIVLSDSDDEIEMIIPNKSATPSKPPSLISPIKPKPPVNLQKPALPPELVQRMSEGNISISPVKPSVQPAPAQNTQLVVVVNETGSHYALALPNGSKLILTPEQVAQIRASNGGKLVL
ncbi:uncharacterized protein LOC131667042 [Phymastichus coffea]|uniref:uncharacterized protein LOC131667042 n=1 Tax=Phymastichus coffea TaxID=108790 RepID=UPI00273AFE02|nr:uncharacterized protein LOC131667042 [Phymastichus coffea]